ncbi:sigma-70 family RNA polymerase sigma factor [Candidatus Gracilibacteria bacterium]|nr:sigma-70 family RNA polymerase sigma factor [Candidatus Gracilibacteria bacterium]
MAQIQTDSVRTNGAAAQSDAASLIALGKQRGFITQDELSKAVSSPEEEAEIYAALDAAGVIVGDPNEAGAEEEPAASQNIVIDESLSDALLGDSVRLYLREIGQVPLLGPEKEKRLAREIALGEVARELLTQLPAGMNPEQVDVDALAEIDDRVGQLAREIRTALWDGPEPLESHARHRLLNIRRLVEAGQDSKMQMAAANLRLVVSIAKRYRDRGLPLLDLIQEGSLGLLRAIDKFEVTKGFKFSTYATWWIKQALSRALADQSRLVRLPVHLGETLNRIQAARRQLTQTLGREPNDGELAVALGMSEEKLRELRRTAQDPVSLATPVGEEADSTLADFIPDPHALDADDAAASGMLRQQIATALDQLTDRERKVLELRYGLADGQPRTLEEVGRAFGVTRERVRQIEVKALRKLRHPRLGKLLKDYLDQI